MANYLLLACIWIVLSASAAIADCLPDFCLQTSKGRTICRKDVAQGALYIDFWASWCPGCVHGLTNLEAIRSQLASDGVSVLAVNLDQERSDAEQFLREHPLDIEVVFDSKGSLADGCSLKSMPASVLFSAAGREVQRWYGAEKMTAANILLAIRTGGQ